MILKIRGSRSRALFLYNFTPRNFKHLAQCLHVRQRHVVLIHLLHGYIIKSLIVKLSVEDDVWIRYFILPLQMLTPRI